MKLHFLTRASALRDQLSKIDEAIGAVRVGTIDVDLTYTGKAFSLTGIVDRQDVRRALEPMLIRKREGLIAELAELGVEAE